MCRRFPVPITNWTECVFYTLPFCWFIFDIFAQWKCIALHIIKKYMRLGTIRPHTHTHSGNPYITIYFSHFIRPSEPNKKLSIEMGHTYKNLFPSILLPASFIAPPLLCTVLNTISNGDAWWRHSFHRNSKDVATQSIQKQFTVDALIRCPDAPHSVAPKPKPKCTFTCMYRHLLCPSILRTISTFPIDVSACSITNAMCYCRNAFVAWSCWSWAAGKAIKT